MRKMTFGSLFSGIGGLDLGIEIAGMRCKWMVEKDDYAFRVLKSAWPNVPIYEDVYKLKGDELGKVDLICGGFPCQPFSVAGKRRGKADERNLWPEMARIIRAVRPRYVLAENVPGVAPYLNEIYDELASAGYEVLPPLEIPAAAVGAPHLRYRMFIVAYSDGNGAERNQSEDGVGSRIKQSGQDVAVVPHADEPRSQGHRSQRELRKASEEVEVGGSGNVADSQNTKWGLGQFSIQETSIGGARNNQFARGGWWLVEPNVGRVAHGVPSRVDRIRCLGNAVVPQVAEWIGRRIIAFERSYVDEQ